MLSAAGEILTRIATEYVEQQPPLPFQRWATRRMKFRLIDHYRTQYGRWQHIRDRRIWAELTDEVANAVLYTDGATDRYGTPEQVVDLTALEWVRDNLDLSERELDLAVRTAVHGETLQQVGEDWGVTESRMCQTRTALRHKAVRAGGSPNWPADTRTTVAHLHPKVRDPCLRAGPAALTVAVSTEKEHQLCVCPTAYANCTHDDPPATTGPAGANGAPPHCCGPPTCGPCPPAQ